MRKSLSEVVKMCEAKNSEDGTLFVDKVEKVVGKWYAPSDELHTNDGWKAVEIPSSVLGHLTKFTDIKKVINIRHNVSSDAFSIEMKPKNFGLASGDLLSLQDFFKLSMRGDSNSITVTLEKK